MNYVTAIFIPKKKTKTDISIPKKKKIMLTETQDFVIVATLPKRTLQANLTYIRNRIEHNGTCRMQEVLPCGLQAGDFAIQYYYLLHKRRVRSVESHAAARSN